MRLRERPLSTERPSMVGRIVPTQIRSALLSEVVSANVETACISAAAFFGSSRNAQLNCTVAPAYRAAFRCAAPRLTKAMAGLGRNNSASLHSDVACCGDGSIFATVQQ